MRPRPSPLAALLALMFLATAFTGCLDGEGGDEEDEPPKQVAAPEWEIGQWWDYSYSIPEEENRGFRLVVASDDGANYWLAADNKHTAEFHAVLNFNPMLGRVNNQNFGIFEKGLTQPLFDFPLKKNKEWTFSLLEEDGSSIFWTAKVVKIERANELVDYVRQPTVLVYIEAIGDGAQKMNYIYDTRAKWVRSLDVDDPAGDNMVSIDLAAKGYGEDHSGIVHFVRAKDLFDREYQVTNSVEVERSDNFTDNGHPTAGDYDQYIYYLHFSTDDDSYATIEIKDRDDVEGYRRTIGENQHGDEQGTIDVVSGEWEVTVTMEGTVDLHMRLAGGIYYEWDLGG